MITTVNAGDASRFDPAMATEDQLTVARQCIMDEFYANSTAPVRYLGKSALRQMMNHKREIEAEMTRRGMFPVETA